MSRYSHTVFAVINAPGVWLFFQGGGVFIRGELLSRILPYKIWFRWFDLGGQSMCPSVKCYDESDCEADGMDYIPQIMIV